MTMRRPRSLLLAAGATALLAATVGVVWAAGSLSAEEQLGKSIFFDQDLSLNKNQSCATCHGPAVGFTGPDGTINLHGAVYEGSIPGAFGDRKPPTSAYADLSPILHVDRKGTWIGGNFWDGRATGEKLGNPAADQAQGPFLNPAEQALPDSACVVYRVWTADYPVDFAEVWGDALASVGWPADVDTECEDPDGWVDLADTDRYKVDAAYDQVALSIAAYEGSPESNRFSSKYDATLGAGAKLTQQEQRGLALFRGKGGCAACHPSNGKGALFTDFTFDNLGIPSNPENPAVLRDPTFVDPGLGGFLATRTDYADLSEDEMGKHKVPTLRNVDLRPSPDVVKAYGHNGYFKSLEGIVHFYNTRDVLPTCAGAYTEAEALAADCWPAPEVAENVNTDELGDLGLSPSEEEAIVAYLKTLSDGYQP
jgi:cytochrome c peroxidase